MHRVFAFLKVGRVKWSNADLKGTATSVEQWWTLLTEGVPPAVAAALLPPEIAQFLPGPHASAERPVTVDAVEAVLVALSRAGRTLADLGYVTKQHTGSVAGVFHSDGGVPKSPVASAAVTASGVVGDRQSTRKYHGRVWQALCLWSADVVADLQAEGHPVFPGACGENLSVTGVDWSALRPGTRLRIGTVLAELSIPTDPCRQIRPFFADAAIRRIDHYRHAGSARWYATVVQPGRVAVGDRVEVEPAA